MEPSGPWTPFTTYAGLASGTGISSSNSNNSSNNFNQRDQSSSGASSMGGTQPSQLLLAAGMSPVVAAAAAANPSFYDPVFSSLLHHHQKTQYEALQRQTNLAKHTASSGSSSASSSNSDTTTDIATAIRNNLQQSATVAAAVAAAAAANNSSLYDQQTSSIIWPQSNNISSNSSVNMSNKKCTENTFNAHISPPFAHNVYTNSSNSSTSTTNQQLVEQIVRNNNTKISKIDGKLPWQGVFSQIQSVSNVPLPPPTMFSTQKDAIIRPTIATTAHQQQPSIIPSQESCIRPTHVPPNLPFVPRHPTPAIERPRYSPIKNLLKPKNYDQLNMIASSHRFVDSEFNQNKTSPQTSPAQQQQQRYSQYRSSPSEDYQRVNTPEYEQQQRSSPLNQSYQVYQSSPNNNQADSCIYSKNFQQQQEKQAMKQAGWESSTQEKRRAAADNSNSNLGSRYIYESLEVMNNGLANNNYDSTTVNLHDLQQGGDNDSDDEYRRRGAAGRKSHKRRRSIDNNTSKKHQAKTSRRITRRTAKDNASSKKKQRIESSDDDDDDDEEVVNDSDSDPVWTPPISDEDEVSKRRKVKAIREENKRSTRATKRVLETETDDEEEEEIAKTPKRRGRKLRSDSPPPDESVIKFILKNEKRYDGNKSDCADDPPPVIDLEKQKLFVNGEFLLKKEDKHERYPPIFRMDGKTLLQKYLPVPGEVGKYQSTSTYSGFVLAQCDQYDIIKVKTIHSMAKNNLIVSYCNDNASDSKSKPIDKSMPLASDDEEDADIAEYYTYKTFIQTLLSQALNSSFIPTVTKANDAYFLDSLRKIDEMLLIKKDEIKKLIKFKGNIEKAIDKWSLCSSAILNNSKCDCTLCQHNPACNLVHIYGESYDPWTLKVLERREESLGDALCDNCHIHLQCYSEIKHYKFNTFLKCTEEVEKIRKESKSEEAIIGKALNEEFVRARYNEFKDLLGFTPDKDDDDEENSEEEEDDDD